MIDRFTTMIASRTEGLPLLQVLWSGHSPGPTGRLQSPDRLPTRPPGRAAAPTGRARNASGLGLRPGPATLTRRARSATSGRHRLGHRHLYSTDRRTAPHPPRRRGPRSFDHRTLGRRRRREGQSSRHSTRRASPRSRHSRWTRSFLGATDPRRYRACEHDRRLLRERRRPHGHDLGETTGPVRPPGVRHLRRRQGDRQGGLGPRPGPPRGPQGPDPGAWPGRLPHHDGGQTPSGPALATSRGGLGEGRGRRPRGRPVETAKDRRPRRGPVGRERPGSGRVRRSSEPSVW